MLVDTSMCSKIGGLIETTFPGSAGGVEYGDRVVLGCPTSPGNFRAVPVRGPEKFTQNHLFFSF